MRLDQCSSTSTSYVDGNDHFEFFWVPHTGWALTKRNNRTDGPVGGRGRLQEFRDRVLMENVAFGAVCRAGRIRPSLMPRLSQVLPNTGRRRVRRAQLPGVRQPPAACTSSRWSTRSRGPRSPARCAGSRSGSTAAGSRISFPVEVRFSRGRRHPAVDRHRPGVGLHRRPRVPGHALRAVLPGRRGDHGPGRRPAPLGQAALPDGGDPGAQVPAVGRWQAVRRRLDPEGGFANAYTDRVLGSGEPPVNADRQPVRPVSTAARAQARCSSAILDGQPQDPADLGLAGVPDVPASGRPAPRPARRPPPATRRAGRRGRPPPTTPRTARGRPPPAAVGPAAGRRPMPSGPGRRPAAISAEPMATGRPRAGHRGRRPGRARRPPRPGRWTRRPCPGQVGEGPDRVGIIGRPAGSPDHGADRGRGPTAAVRRQVAQAGAGDSSRSGW